MSAAAARPTVSVFDATTGQVNDSASVALPAVFTAPIRRDLVATVHKNMDKNNRQAYSVSKFAGHQTSAESWGTGRAVARIPRVAGGGTSRSGQGAFGNMCRGGRMFGPTKTWRRWHRKISVHQKRFAVASAIAASAVPALVMARGHRVEQVDEIPLVVDNLTTITKTKAAYDALSKFGASDDVDKAKASKKVRRGKGKARNRRYVQRRGPLLVFAEGEDVSKAFRNLPGLETSRVDNLSLLDLAPGGHMGRFIVWTKGAFEQLDSVFGTAETPSEQKKGFRIPKPIMANADLARIINSNEVQEALRAPVSQRRDFSLKKNPLTNRGAMFKLNPYARAQRRAQLVAQADRAANKAKVLADRRAANKARKARRTASQAFYKTLVTDDYTTAADHQ